MFLSLRRLPTAFLHTGRVFGESDHRRDTTPYVDLHQVRVVQSQYDSVAIEEKREGKGRVRCGIKTPISSSLSSRSSQHLSIPSAFHLRIEYRVNMQRTVLSLAALSALAAASPISPLNNGQNVTFSISQVPAGRAVKAAPPIALLKAISKYGGTPPSAVAQAAAAAQQSGTITATPSDVRTILPYLRRTCLANSAYRMMMTSTSALSLSATRP